MRGVQYLILRVGLLVMFLIVSSPILFGLIWSFEFIDSHQDYTVLKWVILPIAFVYLFGLPWLANKTAQQMAFENRKLGAAVSIVFHDLRLCLSFLPLVGRWFEPPPDMKEKERDDA